MDYLKLAQEIVAMVDEPGVEIEAYINVGTSTEVLVDRGQVEKFSRAGSKGVGIRAIREGRMGYAYTSDFRQENLKQTVSDAISLASVVAPDPARELPPPQPISDEDLQIFDKRVDALDSDRLVEMAKEIEKAALEYDERILLTNRCTIMARTGTVAIASTTGVAGSYDRSAMIGFVMAMAQDGEDRSMAMHVEASPLLEDFDPKTVGRRAAEKALGLLGGRPVPTQKATVVYSPFAAGSIVGALSRALDAGMVQRSRSFLGERMGEQVASERVSLLDNGRLPGGLGTRPFDDEGVPTSATRLIDEGVLQALLYDHYTATRDGTASSTGNASRSSHESLPDVASSNIYFQPGPEAPEEVIAGVENGLYVESVMNTASINPVSGDYSVAAQGRWIKNGQLTHPVNEVTIAIPLPDLLQNIQAIANDLTFVPLGGIWGAPTMRVDNVMIGGSGESSPST